MRQRLGIMKSGKMDADSYQGTVEGFLDGLPSGLGLVVKRVPLAGKWGKDHQKGKATHSSILTWRIL